MVNLYLLSIVAIILQVICIVKVRRHQHSRVWCSYFHTSLKHVWDYVNQFAEFNHYVNSPVANYKGEMYNLPFNMNTFSKMWNIRTPKEAQDIITKQRSAITSEPKNLEEQAISLVGTDIYEKLIKGYTEKQWGRKCTRIASFYY